MKRITHEDLINMCQLAGIAIQKITRNYVYLDDGKSAKLGQLLPNRCKMGCLDRYKIYAGWEDSSYGINLFQAVNQGKKISVIKMIRGECGCGLKDAKDICDANWNEWSLLCQRKGC